MWGACGVTNTISKPAPMSAPVSTGPARTLLYFRLPMGSQSALRQTHLAWGPVQAADGSLCPLALQGHSCLTMGFMEFSSLAWSPSCPSFSTDLDVCRVLSVTWPHVYGCSSAAMVFLLKYMITSVSLMVSAFCWLNFKERTLNERKSCISWYEADTEFFSFQKNLLSYS